jgi:hypothetical protein
MSKTYILTITYNEDTDEIEYIQEELIDDSDDIFLKYGDIIISDYFDEESLELIENSYILGVS